MLQELWDALPKKLKTPGQLIGKQELGCGATVGVLPCCDFACKACYLQFAAAKQNAVFDNR